MNSIKKAALTSVQNAGRIIARELSNQRKLVLNKSIAEPVTNIDYEVQRYLETELAEILPGSIIIAEENLKRENPIADYAWILDPIDGTTNFVHSYPHFAISLALYKKEKPVFGIVHNPVTQETFHAEKNYGAFLNNKKIEVSRNKTLQSCIVGFGFPYNRDRLSIILAAVNYVLRECQDARRAGSAALDLAYVACGRLDGFFELDLRSWDFSAGKIILEEAGGKVTTWDGVPLDRYDTSSILASNSQIHYELQSLLEPLDFSPNVKLAQGI